MKKKSLLVLIISTVLLLTFSLGVLAAPKLSLYFNGKAQKTEVKIINKKPYISLSDASKLYGGKVTFDKKRNRYSVTSKDYKAPEKGVKSYSVSVSGKSGPMSIKISKVTLDSSYKYNEYMPAIKAVILDATVKNSSSSKVPWYPTQGIYAFNTGEQVDNAILYSANLDGDYLGGVTKKGKIVLKVTSDFNKIKTLKVNISGPYDLENFEKLGEDLDLDVKIK